MDCDVSILKTIIESLGHILQTGINSEKGGFNRYQPDLENIGILEKIEKLQLHPNKSVYQYASQLIENYFQVNDPI